MFTGYRVIELSHDLYAGEEEYGFEAQTRPVRELLPFYADKVPPNQWYVMSQLQLGSHTGTHMEAPYHYIQDGGDIASVPLSRIVGECVLLDFTDKGLGEPITDSDLKERGADIRAGDIVFVHTAFAHFYRTERSHDRPYFSEDAIRWLVEEKKIACLGVDCSGIENRNEPRQPNHYMLFKHGIPLIEHLINLDKLRTRRFFVVAVPLRLHGVEACPLAVIAFEPEES